MKFITLAGFLFRILGSYTRASSAQVKFSTVSSNNIVPYAPLNDTSNYNIMPGMLDNTVLNNPSFQVNEL